MTPSSSDFLDYHETVCDRQLLKVNFPWRNPNFKNEGQIIKQEFCEELNPLEELLIPLEILP